MRERSGRVVYYVLAFVLCPLIAYRVAVDGIRYGLDGRGLPAARTIRRQGRGPRYRLDDLH